MRTYAMHDMPRGRTPESFAYKYEETWNGCAVFTYYTDHPQELYRMIPLSVDQLYGVRITIQTHEGVTALDGMVKQ